MPRDDSAGQTRVLALLDSLYPDDRRGATTLEAYRRLLADLPAAELEEAALVIAATRERFPSVARIRETVIERRLRLPEPIDAWEWASRAAATVLAYRDCGDCGSTGLAAGDRDDRCPSCGGTGEREVARGPLVAAMPEPLRRAYRVVGGAGGIGEADRPEIVRAQFLKAYEALRRRAVEAESLAAAGLRLEPRKPPELPRGDSP